MALLKSGIIYGWGSNNEGQLGDVNNTVRNRPTLIKGNPGRVIGLSTGDYHILALLESGKVYGWGRNSEGQLGNGNTRESNRPQLIEAIPDKVVAISAGEYHSLALLESGEVYGWGRNSAGQLGGDIYLPVLYPRIIQKMDQRMMFSPFGKGGKAVGFNELEKKFQNCSAKNSNFKVVISKSKK